ncbi:hypothetical protein D3C72_1978900 [compost metagenome]
MDIAARAKFNVTANSSHEDLAGERSGSGFWERIVLGCREWDSWYGLLLRNGACGQGNRQRQRHPYFFHRETGLCWLSTYPTTLAIRHHAGMTKPAEAGL